MNVASIPALIEFEVYLLMTMKLRMKMSHNEARLEAKLAEHGLSVDDGNRIHERVAQTLGDEASGFGNLKSLLGIMDQHTRSLKYSSVLWPGFDFTASTGEEGLLESARYWHTRADLRTLDDPTELTIWSLDITEFTKHFGPMTRGRQWPLFDKLLPGYEEYEFQWNGERCGAGFSWGLFMYSAKSWPED
ncbi:hypothetical protein [Mycobacterium sp.]|uniref:hypothetical protein n=1 Tax=Mycobacterium sp. TaxID=1785 RepID=UPI003F9668A8